MPRPPFLLVFGAHAETPVPPSARKARLLHRFAVVQSTYQPDQDSAVVDPAVLIALTRHLDARYAPDAGVLYWDARRQRSFSRIELEAHFRDVPIDQQEIPAVGEWHRAGRLDTLLVTEPWLNVGGPALYHDTLTTSVYTSEDQSAVLMSALAASGLVPERIVQGGQLGGPARLPSAGGDHRPPLADAAEK